MSALAMILAVALATMFTRRSRFFCLPGGGFRARWSIWGARCPRRSWRRWWSTGLKGVDVLHAPYGMAEFVGVAVVVLVHGWRKNTLLSIFAGTACYMALIRILPLMG